MKNLSEENARNLLKTTAESWKIPSLKEYDASEWLNINTGKKGNVISLWTGRGDWGLKCKICNTYSIIIQSIKHFSLTSQQRIKNRIKNNGTALEANELADKIRLDENSS